MALFDDLSTIFGAYATKINSLKSNLGNIANLNTSVKTSIVDAINAAQAELDDAKTDLGAVAEAIGEDAEQFTWVDGYYISLTTDPVDYTPQSSSSGLRYTIVECSEGDKFVINAVGATNGRAWGFVDDEDHVIMVAGSNATALDLHITAPTGAAKLIINDKSNGDSYKIPDTYTGKVVTVSPQTLTEEQKEQVKINLGITAGGNTFDSTFAFRFLNGDVSSAGAVSETNTKRAITRGAVFLREGDQIMSDDTSLINFGLVKYSSPDADVASFVEWVKPLTADESQIVIDADGWYIPIVEFVDKRTINTNVRITAALHVYGIRKGLKEIKNGALENRLFFPYSGDGIDSAYATGLYVRGVNHYQNRSVTLPFLLPQGATMTFPSGMRFSVRQYTVGDSRYNTSTTEMETDGGTYTVESDSWVSLSIGKTDNTDYTSPDAAKEAAQTIMISGVAESREGYESPIYDVKENGCVGDGVADDSLIIQTILNKIRDNGGGKIYFPAGTYKVNNTLILYSNTTVELDEGATILRGANIKFVFLTNCTNSILAYNGEKNIVVKGGKIDIGTGLTQGACAFGFVHAQNIIVENVETVHNNEGYHMYDICGCKNVKIKDCYLHDPITIQASAELIQFDGAGSYTQFPSPQLTDGAATFDDTPCVDIEVSGCTFELNSYSPAFGNHNGQANKNINVHDCVISGTGGTRGAVAFATGTETTTINATTQVFIHHNIFDGCNIGFTFSPVGTGKIYVRDNIFKGITTLKKNPDSPVGEFLNNIELA